MTSVRNGPRPESGSSGIEVGGPYLDRQMLTDRFLAQALERRGCDIDGGDGMTVGGEREAVATLPCGDVEQRVADMIGELLHEPGIGGRQA